MKKILCTFILILSLLTICGCSKEGLLIHELYKKNGDYINDFFDKHEYGEKTVVYTKRQARNKMLEEAITFEECFSFYSGGSIYLVAANYKTEELAKQGIKFLSNYNNFLKRNGTLVYLDCQLSYLLIYGEPLKKDGILYYELEDGNTLFFDMECSCELESSNNGSILEIPNWIELIGGTCAHANYMYHIPKMEELIIPDSVTEIKNAAFVQCTSLKRIKLSTNLKKIGNIAFGYGGSLEYVVVPKSVEEMGKEVFDCGNIYCEAEYKPTGWKKNFAVKDAKVYWASEWEYNEEGIPVPIEV